MFQERLNDQGATIAALSAEVQRMQTQPMRDMASARAREQPPPAIAPQRPLAPAAQPQPQSISVQQAHADRYAAKEPVDRRARQVSEVRFCCFHWLSLK